MDPNANVQERIRLIEQRIANDGWDTHDRDRFAELASAYAEWTGNGGFPADRELRAKLTELLSS